MRAGIDPTKKACELASKAFQEVLRHSSYSINIFAEKKPGYCVASKAFQEVLSIWQIHLAFSFPKNVQSTAISVKSGRSSLTDGFGEKKSLSLFFALLFNFCSASSICKSCLVVIGK